MVPLKVRVMPLNPDNREHIAAYTGRERVMDCREAFKKYTNIVGRAEGVDFLYAENWGDDWPEIAKASQEASLKEEEQP